MAELITKQQIRENVAKERRIDALFKKYPLQPLPTIDTNIPVDWNAPESLQKGILSRFSVAYADPTAKPAEVKAFFMPHILKHCQEIGWEINYDDFGEKAVDAVPLQEPLHWTIFVTLKRNTASHKDLHFGDKPSRIKTIVDAAQQKLNRRKQYG